MISEGLMEKLSVTGLCDDSRRVKPGNLFFSMKPLPVALSRLVPLLLSVRLWLPKD